MSADIPGSDNLSSILESSLLAGSALNPSAGGAYGRRQSGHFERRGNHRLLLPLVLHLLMQLSQNV